MESNVVCCFIGCVNVEEGVGVGEGRPRRGSIWPRRPLLCGRSDAVSPLLPQKSSVRDVLPLPTSPPSVGAHRAVHDLNQHPDQPVLFDPDELPPMEIGWAPTPPSPPPEDLYMSDWSGSNSPNPVPELAPSVTIGITQQSEPAIPLNVVDLPPRPVFSADNQLEENRAEKSSKARHSFWNRMKEHALAQIESLVIFFNVNCLLIIVFVRTEEAIMARIRWEARARIVAKGHLKHLQKSRFLVSTWNLQNLI
jgi:hypothetical protein